MIAIILPCRNEVDHIERAVRSALDQDLGPDTEPHDLEVIIADGMSDDGTRDILARLADEDSRVRVVDNPKKLAAPGLNLAIESTTADVIVRFDAHTEYAPDYVKSCLEVLEETGADNVGGAARTRTTSEWQEAIAAAYHSPFSTGGARFHQPDYEGPADTVTYGCWRREVFERVGLFDEELARNQDDEHNLRIHRAGGTVYQSRRIKSWYAPRSSLRAVFRQYQQYGYWKVRVIQKHKIPASWRHLVPGGFVATVGGLAVLAPFVPPARTTLFGVLGAYGAAVLGASAITASKTRWSLFPKLPVVYPAFHFGYGLGFLLGVKDFVILRKGPSDAQAEITRARPTGPRKVAA